jgi:hypothetical protein
MKNIEIKQVKLIKEGEKVEVVYKETGENKSTVDKTCEDPVHPDLKRVTASLDIHLAILTDYITEKQKDDRDTLDKFVITGYSIGGKEGLEGVTVTGYKKTIRGGTVTLNSPLTRFDGDPQTRYILMDDLQSKIDLVEKEVLAYLFEGKKGADPQGSLFDEKELDEDVTHMQVAVPKSKQDEDAEIMSNLKNQRGHISQANPEAMKSVASWDDPNGEGKVEKKNGKPKNGAAKGQKKKQS